MSVIDSWNDKGVECYYVRFHQPAPPSLNKEPVSEFCTSNMNKKYLVDCITYTPHGVIWKVNGEENIMPLANVIYTRSIV